MLLHGTERELYLEELQKRFPPEQTERPIHYDRLEADFKEKIRTLPERISGDELVTFFKEHRLHDNYYYWLVQYQQKACFVLSTDVSAIRCKVSLVNEHDIVIAIYNADESESVEFTAVVIIDKIVTAIKQVISLKKDN
jgi:hypothetical protein